MRTASITAFALLALLLSACGRPATVAQAAAVSPVDHEALFPLATGEHHKNVECNACHGQFDTFTRFDCLGCHGLAATGMAHSGVADFTYDSPSCYRCHPTGDCHPKEDCQAHPEDCVHAADGMAGMTEAGGADAGVAPDPGANSTAP